MTETMLTWRIPKIAEIVHWTFGVENLGHGDIVVSCIVGAGYTLVVHRYTACREAKNDADFGLGKTAFMRLSQAEKVARQLARRGGRLVALAVGERLSMRL
jgi:hypothetical protein